MKFAAVAKTITPADLGLFVTYTLQYALSKPVHDAKDVAEKRQMFKLIGKSVPILRSPTLVMLASIMQPHTPLATTLKEFKDLKEAVDTALEEKGSNG